MTLFLTVIEYHPSWIMRMATLTMTLFLTVPEQHVGQTDSSRRDGVVGPGHRQDPSWHDATVEGTIPSVVHTAEPRRPDGHRLHRRVFRRPVSLAEARVRLLHGTDAGRGGARGPGWGVEGPTTGGDRQTRSRCGMFIFIVRQGSDGFVNRAKLLCMSVARWLPTVHVCS